MRLFEKAMDGGAHSPVTGYYLLELKGLFSVVLLRFEEGVREEFHTHAFSALSWLLKGALDEYVYGETLPRTYRPSPRPFTTPRERNHRVWSWGTSWVLTFRGPWQPTWQEYHPGTGKATTLTHGRRVVR